ncbi:MAG: hypothetical protein MZV65_31975 [Chromatiales bacterium]|nr:hypothetical protein [Chromatiales bacterium]
MEMFTCPRHAGDLTITPATCAQMYPARQACRALGLAGTLSRLPARGQARR